MSYEPRPSFSTAREVLEWGARRRAIKCEADRIERAHNADPKTDLVFDVPTELIGSVAAELKARGIESEIELS